jgi:multicomponent Na+:H+ antiporter subunit F
MMLVVGIVATALLAAGALLAVVRMERGPSMLDRSVAFDVLTTALVGAIAVETALSRRTEAVPILVVLSMVGFIGSVAIARFAAVEPPKDRQPDGTGPKAPDTEEAP